MKEFSDYELHELNEDIRSRLSKSRNEVNFYSECLHLIDQRTAKKIVFKDNNYFCPCCDSQVYEDVHPKYCGKCGQAIFWREEEW